MIYSYLNPQPEVGKFAKLRVLSSRSAGAYLDWGQKPDLFLPRSEQSAVVSEGDDLIVFITRDPNAQIIASMRLEDYIDEDVSALAKEQKVRLLILGETALGFQALIEGRNLGVLYRSEVFQELAYGDQVAGYVKKIREDGKVDLILQPLGAKGSGDLGQQILAKLRENDGFLPLTDKSSPEKIYTLFGVSKKKYKMALGGIYRDRLVSIDEDGVRLTAAGPG